MAPVSVQIAVLVIAEDPAIADLTAIEIVATRAAAVGHRVISRNAVADSEPAIRSQLARWFDDREVDVVIVLAGESQAISPSLAPLVTQVLPGFTDLFRWLAFQETGASAMLSSAEAAQCGSTFVFVVPGAIGAALDKLILPQFDPATTPRNLIDQIPRLRAKADEGVPVPIVAEKTHGGSGLPARMPASIGTRARPMTGANVVARNKPDDKPADDPPTKPIDVARLERQIARSTTPSHDEVTRLDHALVLPRRPPGASDGDGDLLDDHTATDTLAVPPAPDLPPSGPHPARAQRESKPFSFSTPVRGGAAGASDSTRTRPPTGSTPTPARTRVPTSPPPIPPARTRAPSSPPPTPARTKVPTSPPPIPRERTASGSPANAAKPASPLSVTPASPQRWVATATSLGTPGFSATTAPPAIAPVADDSWSTPVAPASAEAEPPGPANDASWSTTLAAAKAAAEASPVATEPAKPAISAALPSSAETSRAERPSAERPSAERPSAERPSAERPTAERPSAERPSAALPRAELPRAERPGGERPSAERPTAEQPTAEQPTAEQPTAERPTAERPSAELPRTERPGGERPSAELPRAQAPLATAASAIASSSATTAAIGTAAASTAASGGGPAASPSTTAAVPSTATATAAAFDAPRGRQPTPAPPLPARSVRTPTVPPPANVTDNDLPVGAFTYSQKPRAGNVVLKVIAALGATVLGFLAVVYFLDRDGDPATKVATDPPTAIDRSAAGSATGSATPEPDIEMDTGASTSSTGAPATGAPATGTPATGTPATGTPATGTASTGNASTGTRPRPRPPATPPVIAATTGSATDTAPADPPPPPPDPEPSEADLCTEADCVLSEYDRPCCAKYKPKGPVIAQRVGGVPQSLDRTMVRAGVEGIKPRVIACGEKSGVQGTVRIAVAVSPDGGVTSAEVQASPNAALGTCVVGAVRIAKFGKSIEGGSFTYPFVF